MAHPIQRARQALRNAEAQTEQADGNGNQTEDDMEAGLGERPDPPHQPTPADIALHDQLSNVYPKLCTRGR